MHNFERSLQLLYVVQFVECGPDAAVQAEYLVVNECSHGQVLEDSVERVEHRLFLVKRIFAQPHAAFIRESEVIVDEFVLVVAADHVDAVWLLALEGKQQAECLETVCAPVNLVAQE